MLFLLSQEPADVLHDVIVSRHNRPVDDYRRLTDRVCYPRRFAAAKWVHQESGDWDIATNAANAESAQSEEAWPHFRCKRRRVVEQVSSCFNFIRRILLLQNSLLL